MGAAIKCRAWLDRLKRESLPQYLYAQPKIRRCEWRPGMGAGLRALEQSSRMHALDVAHEGRVDAVSE